jgi:hypothetical protein
MKDDTELKKDCDILKQIASRYPGESVEVLTLRKAAVALQVVFLKGIQSELNRCLEANDKTLTKEQKSNLKRMGVE